LELIRQARELLPSLPTDTLYGVHDLLERALTEPELDPGLLEELERAIRP
jgi:hypothetical protein